MLDPHNTTQISPNNAIYVVGISLDTNEISLDKNKCTLYNKHTLNGFRVRYVTNTTQILPKITLYVCMSCEQAQTGRSSEDLVLHVRLVYRWNIKMFNKSVKSFPQWILNCHITRFLNTLEYGYIHLFENR